MSSVNLVKILNLFYKRFSNGGHQIQSCKTIEMRDRACIIICELRDVFLIKGLVRIVRLKKSIHDFIESYYNENQ